MKKLAVLFAAAALAAGCNTTNAFMRVAPDYADLPEAELRSLAASIEAIAAGGSEEFSLESSGGIIADTPEIRQALRTRVIRHPLISEFLSSGFGIEQRGGLIAVQRSNAYKKATTSRQRDRDALLVQSENQNRWTIYEGLLKANNWPPKALSAVQAIFHEARLPLLESGQPREEAAQAGPG